MDQGSSPLKVFLAHLVVINSCVWSAKPFSHVQQSVALTESPSKRPLVVTWHRKCIMDSGQEKQQHVSASVCEPARYLLLLITFAGVRCEFLLT